MTSNLVRYYRFIPLLLLPLTGLRAEEASLRDLLRDALYTEEVSRDAEKAAQQYDELLSRLDEQRHFAATAIFRLAEVRRKQGRKEEAVQLYQRLIREFPAAGPEVKLATENLAALGAKVPEAGNPVSDEETKELLRLQALATTGPDLLRDPTKIAGAAQKGWLRVVNFLLAQGQDPYGSRALAAATTSGYLSVCKAILQAKGPPPAEIADEALQAAVINKRQEILKLYLESGFDANRALVLPQSLRRTPADWDRGITELLVSSGANLDVMPAKTAPPSDSNNPVGSALHEALSHGNIAAANYLLDRGCKPDLATPDYNISPLHIAASSDKKEMSQLVKRLLDAGADPNRETTLNLSGGPLGFWTKATPLELAARSANKDSLAHLIAAGAEANRREALQAALDHQDAEMLETLLKAGLDPKGFSLPHNANLKDDTVFGYLASRQGGSTERILDLLIQHGAKPDQAWMESRFFGAPVEMRRILNRKFIYSSLAERPAITAIFNGGGMAGVQAELVGQEGDSEPPPFASLYHRIQETANQGNNGMASETATIARRKEGGGFEEIPVDLKNDSPPPALRWGDIIEFPQPNNGSGRSYNSSEVYWMYRSKLTLPVSVEIGGTKKSFVMDGSRLVFDVTSDRLPWGSAGQVIDLLWPTPLTPDELSGKGIVISVARKNWPRLRLDYPSPESGKFELQAGDELKLEVPAATEAAIAESRKKGVTVRAPGHPYLMYFTAVPNPGAGDNPTTAAPMIPTLSQLLAEIYGGAGAVVPWYLNSGDAGLGALSSNESDLWQKFTVLPFPDFSAIRILRPREDGGDEEINVDWSKAIEAITDQSDSGEVKKSDVVLKAGDIVELRVRKNRPAGDWRGFSPKEELLLAKMMQGQFQHSDGEGRITLQQLTYKAPIYRETKAGWLPTTPPGGSASMTFADVLKRPNNQGTPTFANLTRGDEAFHNLPNKNVFLRDGDVVNDATSGFPPRPGFRQPVQPVQPGRR